MTPQERELLTGFLNNLTTAQAGNVDADADQLIRNAFARQPQAAYLLVQQALMQQLSLRDAQARIADLEQQVRQGASAAPGGSSFLGGTTQTRTATPPPPAAPAGWANPAVGAGAPSPSGVGSFLRSAAATAAGVAGGAMLFQGIESLFGGHRGMPGGGGFLGNGTPEIIENDTVINEYANPDLQGASDPSQGLNDGFAGDADFGDDGSLFDNGDDSTDWV